MILRKLAIIASFFSMTVFAQSGLKMSYAITSDKGATGTFTIYSMGGNSRSEMEFKVPVMPNSVKMVSIVQSEKPTTLLQLNETNKTYSEVASTPQETAPNEKESSVTLLGKEKIGEYNCTHVKVKQDRMEYEMWLTQDIAEGENYFKTSKENTYMGNAKLYKALADKKAAGFPVKIVHGETGGMEGTVTITLKKYSKETIAADKFSVPAGYTKNTGSAIVPAGIPNAEDIMKMTPEEREKYIQKMKEQYGVK